MATYQFECENGHVTEKFFKTLSPPETISCSCQDCPASANRGVIGGTSKAPVGVPAVQFQKYAFGEHGFSTHNDRKAWLDDLNQQDW